MGAYALKIVKLLILIVQIETDKRDYYKRYDLALSLAGHLTRTTKIFFYK